MSIQLNKTLPVLAFSQNTISCQLLSNDYMAAAGTPAITALKLTGALTADMNILLSWNAVKVQITVNDNPDDSATQIPAGDGGTVHAASIAAILKDNYLLGADFLIEADEQQINFTSLQPGVGYAVSGAVTGNFQITPVQSGTEKAMKPNFAHHLEVWARKPNSSAFKQVFVANVELDYPITGITDTDIGPEILHNELEPDLPVLSGVAITPCLSSIAEYYIRFAQYFGDTAQVKRLYTSPIALVALGGLSLFAATQRNILSDLQPDQNDETKNRFLRQGSLTKLVTKEQPEWLYYINLKSAARKITADVEITNSDSSTLSFSFGNGTAIDAYAKCQIPAGFTQLGIQARQPADKLPVYYTVRLRDESGYITAAYTYVVDYTYNEWKRYFVYLNAYGAFQTLAVTGQGQLGFSRKKQDARLDKAAGRIAAEGEYTEYNITIQETGTINIGFNRASKRITALIRDFVSSAEKYLYQDGRLVPIGISTSDFKDAPDGTDIYAGTFEYFHSMEENRHSEPLGLPDDALNDLMRLAGSPIPQLFPGNTLSNYLSEIRDDLDSGNEEIFDDF